MRILSFGIVLFALLSPISAFAEVSRDEGGSDSARVYLNSDTGTYKIGFSSNTTGISNWSDPVNEITSAITRAVSGTGEQSLINPGRVYWKIRSAGNYSLYLFKSSADLIEENGTQRISWTVTVPNLSGTGDITIVENRDPAAFEGFTPIFSRNFDGVMAVDVNSLPLDISVDIPSDVISGEFHGSLILSLVSGE